jgi:hypothetical protein
MLDCDGDKEYPARTTVLSVGRYAIPRLGANNLFETLIPQSIGRAPTPQWLTVRLGMSIK